MSYSNLIDSIREDVHQMNEMAGIKSIVIISTEGVPPDSVTKAKFIVHSNTGRMYKYEAEASPFVLKTFIDEVDKHKLGVAINTIAPYIVNYKDTLGELDEGIGKTLAGAAIAGSMLLGAPQGVQAKQPVHITQQEQKIDIEKLLHAIKQVESSGGVDKRDRYEAGVDRQLHNRYNKLNTNTKNAIDAYGFKRVASSYGPYQIMASTAYDLGFNKEPEALRDENLSKQYVQALLNQIINSKRTNNIQDVVSAYNAGLGGVGTNPDYIQKVLKFYNVNESTTLEKAAEDIDDLIKIQTTEPSVKQGDKEGEYMRGLANGLIVAKSAVDGKEPRLLNPDGKLEKLNNTQLEIPKEFTKDILKLVNSIPKEELYTEDDDYGRELHPHITIKYGLETHFPEEIKKLVEENKDIKPFGIVLGKLSIFSKDDKPYDVVKVDIEGDKELQELNKLLSKLPNKDENPKYIPHLTIAYVKKGEGNKYVGREDLKGIEIGFDSFMFKGRDGQDLKIEL